MIRPIDIVANFMRVLQDDDTGLDGNGFRWEAAADTHTNRPPTV